MNMELDDLARLAREQEPELSVSNSSATGLQACTSMLSFIYGGAMNSNPDHHPSPTQILSSLTF